MDNPINKIEDDKACLDMGRMGALVFGGALEESKSVETALRVTEAYFFGMFKSAASANKEEDEETPSS